ncbi:SurA N-terminal domain-containing protein [Azomonas macrocytogenes]|uniref:Periplasmic chaperone PpiD n=1 Tax=Azomonas macrocytogenes TaxID=69962 RepID=A0A839T5Z5_AZOMA|nr:SurA N-terminal domain-containing protein [Azomonas macrocytogenes]MBB3104518.1 peptidyl-prolyl cis-trans isomerase D [Azomonas macrocytogenes]
MLQNIRDNSQGWIAKTIIGLIIMLMALTGIEAIFNQSGNQQKAAEVNGETISQAQLGQAINMQRAQLAQQLGGNFDSSLLRDEFLRASALNGVIDRTLLLQSAKRSGFSYSASALDQVILQTPEFQADGKFDPIRFDQVIRNMGYSRLQFRQLLEQEMLIGQLRAGIIGTGFVTDQQVDAFARLERQTRDFGMYTITANVEAMAVTDEDIQHYYEANAGRFRSPEQVVAEYVELKKDVFFDQVSVNESQIKAFYEKQIADLGEQRRAAHILIEVNDKISDEQARAKIEDIHARLEKGEDFATLAKQESQDPGSAKDGGDLGFAGPGVYDPTFEKALYALKEGEISVPVRSAFGWHLIKLLGVQAPEIPTLESLRPELVRQLKAEQVEQRFVEASKQLESSAYESADLAQPAQESGLKVETTAPFGREGGEGIAANKQVIQAAFSDQVLVDGANSDLIELDPETVLVLRVKEHRKPEALPLNQVKDGIAKQLKHEKATEKARQDGQGLLAKLQGKDSAATEGDSANWQQVEAAARNQDGVDPAVLQAVFRMPKPKDKNLSSYSSVTLNNGNFVVLRLDGVSAPEEPLNAEQKQEYRRFLASRAGQQDFSAFMNKIRSTAEIERF